MKTLSRYSHRGLRGCHACGSTDVQAVCHHCGRPLCGQHLATPDPKEPSIEFLGLRTDPENPERFPAPVHCKDCVHVVRRPSSALLFWGGGIAAAGILAGFIQPWAGVALGVVGVGLAVYGWIRKRAAQAEFERRRPVFPVSDVETQVIGSTTYAARFEIGPEGEVSSGCTMAEQDLRLLVILAEGEAARVRGELKAGVDRVPVHAGFLLPVAGSQLRLESAGNDAEADRAIPLRLELSADRIVNSAADAVRMQVEMPLASRNGVASDDLSPCVSVIAGITPGSHQSALELHVLTAPWKAGSGQARVGGIEALEIDVPFSWGRVVAVSAEHFTTADGHRSVDGVREPCRTIRIPSPPLDPDGRPGTVSLRFTHPIQSGQWVTGRLVAAIKTPEAADGPHGGMAGGCFEPWGASRGSVTFNVTSRLRLEFRISTSPFRYQSILVKPDSAGQVQGTREEGGKEDAAPMRFPGVVPNHEAVIQFARTLVGTPDLYLRTLAETAPEAGVARGERVRCWTLAGRGYRGLVPIDFEVRLRGSEQASAAETSHVVVEVSVRGVYNSTELRDEIHALWRLLRRQATATFGHPCPA